VELVSQQLKLAIEVVISVPEIEIKPGDLVKFWDYEGGDGFVIGIVTKIKVEPSKIPEDDVLLTTALVAYNGAIQQVPVSGEDAPVLVY
jgi:hypothetical protein